MSAFPIAPEDPGAVHASSALVGASCGASGADADILIRVSCRACLERAQANLDRIAGDPRDRRALSRFNRSTPAC